jgi:hypothetical protein
VVPRAMHLAAGSRKSHEIQPEAYCQRPGTGLSVISTEGRNLEIPHMRSG